ncbi:MAG: energy transducer TonB [Mariprofundus sp.]|nr:energy transducer TonB [Mariprofundus sp.]
MSPSDKPASLSFAEQGRRSQEHKNAWHRSASLLLAAAIHIALLIQFGSLIKPEAAVPHREALLEVELVTATMPSDAPEKLTPEPEKDKKEVVPLSELVASIAKPEPVEKKQVKKIRPKPHRLTPPAPPVPRPTQALRQTVATTVQLAIAIQKPIVMQHTNPAPRIENEMNRLKMLRQQYMAHIMAVIKAHKTYPYSARRRHIEGDITVVLTIASTGHVSDIQISGKSGVLRTASMNAVQASLTLPLPPAELLSPLRATFIMQYNLRDL